MYSVRQTSGPERLQSCNLQNYNFHNSGDKAGIRIRTATLIMWIQYSKHLAGRLIRVFMKGSGKIHSKDHQGIDIEHRDLVAHRHFDDMMNT